MMLKQEMNMVPYIAVSINHLCALVRESLDRRPKKIDTTHVVSVVQQDFLNLDLFYRFDLSAVLLVLVDGGTHIVVA